MSNCSTLKISKGALLKNLSILRKYSSGAVICPIVKANAYGHGIKQILEILISQNIPWLGVHSVDEGVLLRRLGFMGSILNMGYVQKNSCQCAVEHLLSLSVCNMETLEFLSAQEKPVHVHLKFETGTNRQGILQEEIKKYADFIKAHSNIHLQGVYTHFANIEDTTNPSFAISQLQKFISMTDEIKSWGLNPPLMHTACSAALLLFPQTRF
ncbi:MAG: alanine racemase, partial [bacterium]